MVCTYIYYIHGRTGGKMQRNIKMALAKIEAGEIVRVHCKANQVEALLKAGIPKKCIYAEKEKP